MSLRILHIAPYSPDAWAYGGIPRVVSGMTRGLAARGHRVTLCATDAHDSRSRLASSTPTSRSSHPPRLVDGVEWRLFRNVSNRAAYHLQAFAPVGLRRYLAAHAREFDIAHVHACHNLPGVLAARALSHAGVPWVLSPNGTAPLMERRLTLKRVFDACAGDDVLRRASAVFAVSAAEQAQLLELGIAPSRIWRLPNPVDACEAPPVAGGRFRDRHGLGASPLIAFVGKITPRKQVETIVQAFSRIGFPAAQLVLAGNDLGGLRPAMARAEREGVRSRVHTPGLLPGAARLELMADADLVVYPSHDEVFGLVPCEALVQGTPVIVGNDSGCAEIVHAVGGGIAVAPGNPHVLALAIEQVLRERTAWKRRAAASGQRVRALFGERTIASQLDDLYSDVLDSPRARLSA